MLTLRQLYNIKLMHTYSCSCENHFSVVLTSLSWNLSWKYAICVNTIFFAFLQPTPNQHPTNNQPTSYQHPTNPKPTPNPNQPPLSPSLLIVQITILSSSLIFFSESRTADRYLKRSVFYIFIQIHFLVMTLTLAKMSRPQWTWLLDYTLGWLWPHVSRNVYSTCISSV